MLVTIPDPLTPQEVAYIRQLLETIDGRDTAGDQAAAITLNLQVPTDISTTTFVTKPDEYDGGELVVHDTYGEHKVKLPAGHAVVYPATSLHSVTPVTRGPRRASFLRAPSMVKDDWPRNMFYDLDMDPATGALKSHYHNPIRQWL